MRVDLLEQFATIVGPPRAAVPLFESSMIYAAALQDGDVWPAAMATQRELEQAVAVHCSGREGAIDIVEGVLEFLRVQQFRGNIRAYEDPRNSLMDRVLERRLGLPISLCVLAIHLAERCGVELHGIAFPGHFLIGLELREGNDDPCVWDPFRGGRRLLIDELAVLFTMVVGHHVEPDSPVLLEQLRPCHSRLILTRQLENLRRHYDLSATPERVADTLELLATLHPDEPQIRALLAAHPGQRHLIN